MHYLTLVHTHTLTFELRLYCIITGNVWIRRDPLEYQSDLVLVDWEMCCIHVPQRDPAHFLSFTLPPAKTPAEMLNMFTEYAEYYRKELVKNLLDIQHPSAAIFKDKEKFYRIFDYMVFECVVNRAFNAIGFPPAFCKWTIRERIEKVLLYVEAVAERNGFVQQ